MTVIIFCGPTLASDDARRDLDALYLPPASQGDVYRAAQRQPRVIGIIDGAFERVPAVGHKEILWAMAQGVHVFGSAGMGALRAVELRAFGMEGAGEIFQGYCDGTLEDDDEVMVAHGPAESGYRTLSVAMVNIRRTFELAVAQGLIAPATGTRLTEIAKALFYPQRAYPRILRDAAEQGMPHTELEALRTWLPRSRIDLKRSDALTMLRIIRERLAAGLPQKRVRYHFENTEFWQRLQRESATTAPADDQPARLVSDPLLDEVRLLPEQYHQARHAALVNDLARALAARIGYSPGALALRTAADTFRRERGLYEPAAVAEWLALHDVGEEELRRLMEGQALHAWAVRQMSPRLADRLRDELRLNGAYVELRDRAGNKQRALSEAGLAERSLAELGISAANLMQWYFTERLGLPVPDDLETYAQEIGFAHVHALMRAVLREYCYTVILAR